MARKWILFQRPIQSFLIDSFQLLKLKKILILFLLGILLNLLIIPVYSQVNAEQLVKQAESAYQAGSLLEASQKLQEAVDLLRSQGNNQVKNLAISSTNLCRIQLELGQAENALKNCSTATEIYQHLQDKIGQIRSQTYQAYALQQLGFYPSGCLLIAKTVRLNINTCNELTQNILQEKIKEQTLDTTLITAWRVLGDSLRAIGQLNESKIILEKLTELPLNPEIAATWLSLGNTLTALGNLERDRQSNARYNYQPWQCELMVLSELTKNYYSEALTSYEKSSILGKLSIKTKANLNRLKLLTELNKLADVESLISEIDLTSLPLTQFKIYGKINYNKSLACLKQNNSSNNIIQNLELAVAEAYQLGNKKSESYTLGALGGFYEYLKKYTEAKIKTEEALYLAQDFPDLAYQWYWQLGRIYESKGEREKAINNYELAVKTLDRVRQDLLQINSDVQFSFRDDVEPLYRQLILNLLLLKETLPNRPQLIEKSIYYIESLQLAELYNFLRCNPEDYSQENIQKFNSLNDSISQLSQKIEQVHKIDSKAALIYPFVLSERLAIILALPEQSIQIYTTPVLASQVNDNITKLRKYLKTPRREQEVKFLSQQIYNWLIKPFASELLQHQIKTLVFILDSSLQNIPMAALYDGENYLIKNYAVALIPSLQLLNPHPRSRAKISALMAGATDAPSFQQENLSPLPNVKEELEGISQEVKQHRRLFEQDFIENNIEKEINSNSFSIVHFATHGQFSSNPEQTYILDWNQRLKIQDLENLLRLNQKQNFAPIDLLILSACETATGDRRAALGLAGVALRAGARSTLATLWQVNDESTAKLMIQFYQNLQNPKLSKVEALRIAQLSFLNKDDDKDYNRAYYWAPFVIVGNWL